MNTNDNPTLSMETVAALTRARADAELWRDEAGARSWRDFCAALEAARQKCLVAGVAAGSVIVVPAEGNFAFLPWFFGAAMAGAVVAPLRAERTAEIEAWKKFITVSWRVRDGRIEPVGEGTFAPEAARLFDRLKGRRHPGLILATGGTTGTPKLVLHDLSALLATIPVKAGPPRRTLPLMRFDHIGGLDMAWRALAGGQVLVTPPAELTAETVAAAIARHRVEVMPATPSFLNLLLLAEVVRAHDLSSLRLVPYGAEPMPAGLLERLRMAFPKVEFVQRFGTSETGALPVRNHGSGLLLRDDKAGFSWKIVDGELWIQSPACALGYLSGAARGLDQSGWFRTGDLAEQLPDGTVRVLGRREELINVGGEKVLPSEVESALLSHPLVADCRVGAEPNAVLGQVVTAEIVWRGPERDALAVKRALHGFAGTMIARQKLPAVVRLVEAIGATRNLKKARFSTS